MKIVSGFICRLAPGSVESYTELTDEDKPDGIELAGGPYSAIAPIREGDRVFRNGTVPKACVVWRERPAYEVHVQLLGDPERPEDLQEELIVTAAKSVLAGRAVYGDWCARFAHRNGDAVRTWQDSGGRSNPMSQLTWRDSATYKESAAEDEGADGGYRCALTLFAPRLPAIFAPGGGLDEWPDARQARPDGLGWVDLEQRDRSE